MVRRKEPPTVRLLYVPDCPHVDRLRVVLYDCLRRTGVDTAVEEAEGRYPSPTLLVDELDVVTGRPPALDACCRLDLPTRDQIVTALRRGARQ